MFEQLWSKLRRFAVGGCAALLLASGAARAEDNDADLKSRIERLERQNEYLQKALESGIRPSGGGEESQPNKAEVEKIVADYLKAQGDKAAADAKAKADAGYEVGKETTFRAYFNNGLHFETADKAFKAALRGRWQNDWGFATQDNNISVGAGAIGGGNGLATLEDGINFRRARLGVQGTIWEQFDFVAEFDFADGANINFREVWMGAHDLPVVGTFRVGHYKEQFSLEELTSSRFLTFIERSIIDEAFVPAYNTGMLVQNTAAEERVQWALGLHRTTLDAGGADTGDGELAVTGRVSVLPWYANDGRCLLHLGAAASWRDLDNGLVPQANYRSRPYRVDPESFLDVRNIRGDNLNLYGLEALLITGPFSVQAEYIYNTISNAFSPAAAAAVLGGAGNGGVAIGDVNFQGFYVYATYFLTGENRVYNRPGGTPTRQRVYEPFFLVRKGEDGCSGVCMGSGAWELAARYAWLDLDDTGVTNGGFLRVFTAGVNWYWNSNMKVQWNYEHINRDGPAILTDGNADTFVMRFAWDF